MTDPAGIAGLRRVLAQLSESADEVIETSCAYVILKGPRAYKLKKPVDFGFLDFTTPEKRATAINRELRFNQRLAADIYLGIEDVAGECVLVMRRFDTTAVLASLAGGAWVPAPQMIRDLGKTIAGFHAGAQVCSDPSHADNIGYVISTSRDNINLFSAELHEAAVAAYDAAITSEYNRLRGTMQRRFEVGQVRHCHGDLHLGNILLEDGHPVLFDCIEFNDKLSQIDVLYDLAFLLMDLWVRGYREAANRAMNAWLEQTARLELDVTAAYRSLQLLPFYMAVRAGVRCHVSAHQGDFDQARRYLAAAQAFLCPGTHCLMAIGGLSGSGKSTRAAHEAPGLGRAPGAVILRSDEIRKRLWSCPEFEPLPDEAYKTAASERVLVDMLTCADATLKAGQGLILDATFRETTWRQAAESTAARNQVKFSGIWLEVPAAKRAARVGARMDDVSDATPGIALEQMSQDVVFPPWCVESEAMP